LLTYVYLSLISLPMSTTEEPKTEAKKAEEPVVGKKAGKDAPPVNIGWDSHKPVVRGDRIVEATTHRGAEYFHSCHMERINLLRIQSCIFALFCDRHASFCGFFLVIRKKTNNFFV